MREQIKNRRSSETITFEVMDKKYTVTYARFDDGRIAELFLNNHRSSSDLDTAARDAAITFSIAVQYGADAEVIRKALSRDLNGRPMGPLAKALDLIQKED